MYKEEELKKVVEVSKSKTEVLEKFGKKNNGGNFNVLTFYLNTYNINISHFNKRGLFNKTNIIKKNMEDILIKDSKYTSSNHLKNRLYKEKLKERKCELCGQGEEWNGNHMSLILDHINGSKFDNRIENLRIVCPNCNATLDTHCRGERYKKDKFYKRKEDKKFNICECGKKIKCRSKKCNKCSNLSRRKVERPSYEILMKEVLEMGKEGVGRKYGVTGNSVKKWIKVYKEKIKEKTVV